MKQRVVITGLGVVSPLGQGAGVFWEHLLAGANGIRTISGFDTEGLETRIAGQITDFVLSSRIGHKEARRMARFTQFAVAAAFEALEHSAAELCGLDPYSVGVTIGCGIGGLDVIEEQHRILQSKGAKRVSPLLIPMFIPNIAAGQVAIHTGARGPNTCPVTACASAAHAIGDALLMVVADGMGGHHYGEIAAQIAVQTLADAFQREARPVLGDPFRFLQKGMTNAHHAILDYTARHRLKDTPRTTCVACIVQDNVAYWAHAGDSRLYLMRDGKVITQTKDHSRIRLLVEEGMITEAQAVFHPDRNKI
ncbi:MAG: hypothetical protein CVV27_13835, partial [Candidatus Melainabacteria bacterium HGW-Melainabacteria-1]